MPREKKTTIVKISLLRPVLASIELARKASMARRQGLKPAIRPAARTAAADEMVRSLSAFSEAHAGGVITAVCKSLLAKAGDRTMSNTTITRIAVMQYLTLGIPFLPIPVFPDRCIMVIKAANWETAGWRFYPAMSCTISNQFTSISS